MPRFAGTPLESDFQRLERRRELNDALLEQSMAPYAGTEVVTGHAVDDRLGQGIGRIGQAIISAIGQKRADKDAAAMNKTYSDEQSRAANEVMNALQGQGNAGPAGPQVPVKPDRDKAAMLLATDPYLQNNDVAKALINSGAYGGGGTNRQHYTYQPGEDGNLYKLPGRPGEDPSMVMIDGKPVPAAKYNAPTIYNVSGAREAAKQHQLNANEPARKADVTAAEQGRLGETPHTQAQEAADKETATSASKREFNAEGMGSILKGAKHILENRNPTASGIGKFADWVTNIFGITLPGETAAKDLEILGAAMTGKMPRFEGPQSDPDRVYYEQMAGRIGDSGVPKDQRLAAIEIVSGVWARYEKTGEFTIPDNPLVNPQATEDPLGLR